MAHDTQHTHRHHHREDSATKFKRSSLQALERQKFIEKYLKRFLIVLSILMAISVVIAYKFT